MIFIRAVIIAGGEFKRANYNLIKEKICEDDKIICADGGYLHAVAAGLPVYAVVGDFDTLKIRPNGVKIIEYPVKKDKTDTELAIDFARSEFKEIKDFMITGAFGGRLDHELGNMLFLKNFCDNGETCFITDGVTEITAIISGQAVEMKDKREEILSLIPIWNCAGVSESGVEYPLENAELKTGSSLGLSNIITDDCTKISIEHGFLLIVTTKED